MTTIPWRKASFALVASGAATLALAQDTNNNTQYQNTPSRSTAAQTESMQHMPQNTPAGNLPPQSFPERMLNAITAQQFVTDAAVGGMKEIRLSEIALEKSQNHQIRDFANRMVHDHSEANAKLEQIAQQKGLDLPATNTFAADDANWRNPIITGSEQVKEAYLLTTNVPVAAYQDFKRLKSLSGREFDDAYVKVMVSDHILTIREFEMAQRNLSDPELRQFAMQTLPTLRMHSEMAQRLENEQTQMPNSSTTAYPNNGYNNNYNPNTQPTQGQQGQADQQRDQQTLQQQQPQPSDTQGK